MIDDTVTVITHTKLKEGGTCFLRAGSVGVLVGSAQDRVSVLCQGCLKCDEYVIDLVPRDGVHKTIMEWVYDKRPVSAIAQQLATCTNGVLDALQLSIGASH